MRNVGNSSMSDVMIRIAERYGAEIIYENTRLVGLFHDFAPKMEHEYKLLKIAVDENIVLDFKDCPVDDREMRIKQGVKKLAQKMGESDATIVVGAFTAALGWKRQEREQQENEGQEREQQENEGQEREQQEKEGQERERQEQEQQEKERRKRKRYKWLMMGFLAIVIIGGVVVPSNNTKKTITITTTNTSSSTTNNANHQESSDASLDGVEIGMTAKDLISYKGSTNSYDDYFLPGYTLYSYQKTKVLVKGDRVCAIWTNTNTVSTKRGIHMGSSADDLAKEYGTKKTIYFNDHIYEVTSAENKRCYVGFELGNGVVRNILIADKDVYDIIVATFALTTFHDLITKRDYDSAYEYYLTENMRNQLETYDKWKAGYRNTVKSEIKKINSVRKVGDNVEIAYDLEAVDNPGGTHYYTGKAIIKKNGGWWAIDSMRNR